MPNWCWNHLEVMCTEEHVAELQDFVENQQKLQKKNFLLKELCPAVIVKTGMTGLAKTGVQNGMRVSLI